ncbi:hypothetical protein Tco_0827846 [Tanacetum coccineum]
MTTPITTSTTDSQMHNNIMAVGSRDRPPMLATGRYAQWRSLSYVAPTTKSSPAVPEHTTVETILNMSPANKAHFESEKEAIHMILTGIGDEIYFTIDAAIQLMKYGKLLKGYNNVNPSTFKMSRQTYFGSLENSPLTMENQ